MPIVKIIAVGVPIALGVAMIGAGVANALGSASVRESFARWGYPSGFHRVAGGLEVTAGLLLLVPLMSRVGAVVSAAILLAAMATVIRHREWGHLPGAVVLTAVSAAAIAMPG